MDIFVIAARFMGMVLTFRKTTSRSQSESFTAHRLDGFTPFKLLPLILYLICIIASVNQVLKQHRQHVQMHNADSFSSIEDKAIKWLVQYRIYNKFHQTDQ